MTCLTIIRWSSAMPRQARQVGQRRCPRRECRAVTVAGWAGHSVEVLLKIYAKCLDGEAVTVRQHAEAALGHRPG